MSIQPDSLELLTRLTAGRYVVEREVGRGGMGVVFLARDLSLDRPVAIKLLPEALAADPQLRQRFLQEARTAAQLSHPHIVPVHAVEEHASALFYVMGFVEGETLTARMRRVGRLSTSDVVRLLQQVGWALAYAHGRGVVHRDIKPDNILIEHGTGHAWVLDFGIARVERAGKRAPGSQLTEVGMTVGTPEFMSPEQSTGDAVDGRSDLYSLGVVAYMALAGRVPLEANSTRSLIARRLTEDAPPLAATCPGVPATLARLVDAMLSRDPADRPATGEAVIEAISRGGAERSDVAPAVRAYVRSAEQETVGLLRAAWIAVMVGATRPSSLVVLLVVITALMAGAFGRLMAGARRLTVLGYQWVDIQVGIGDYARDSAREDREFLAIEPPEVLRAARRRAIGAFLAGMVIFVAFIAAARLLRGSADELSRAGAMALIVVGGVLLAISTVPLSFFASLLAGNRSSKAGARRLPTALAIVASPVGRLAFRLGSRDVAPQPPRSLRGQVQLVLRELEDGRGDPSRDRQVQDAALRLTSLVAQEEALRASLARIARAEGEAGAGTAAPVLREERARLQAHAGEVVHAMEELRQQLLLLRAGVDVAAAA